MTAAAGRPRKSAARPFRLTALEPTEEQLHQSAAELLDWLILPPAFYTTFPAGWGELPKSTAARLKRCGLKPGMPDMLVFDVGRVIGIELKARKGRVSPYQGSMRERLGKVGVDVYICRSLDEIIGVLKDENIQLRARWVDSYGQTQSDEGTEGRGATESP